MRGEGNDLRKERLLASCQEFAISFPALREVLDGKGQAAKAGEQPDRQVGALLCCPCRNLKVTMTGYIPAFSRKTGIQVPTEERETCIALCKCIGLPGDRARKGCLFPRSRYCGHDVATFAQASRDFSRHFRCSGSLLCCELWLPGTCLCVEHVLKRTYRYRRPCDRRSYR